MAEAQQPQSQPSTGHSGQSQSAPRRHRARRGARGGGGGGGGATDVGGEGARGGRTSGASEVAPAHRSDPIPTPVSGARTTGDVSSERSESSIGFSRGRGRGGGGLARQGRGRGGRGGRGAAAASAVVPQRAFGGHLTSALSSNEPEAPSALSADAPDFVPGQPIAQRISQTARSRVDAGSGPAKGSKSSAADLPTRIHEDINNRQYECVICTNDVLRNSRVWSCSICWMVSHLHCVKKWFKNQVENNERPQNPDRTGWRCPGCNSAMSDDPGTYHCWCAKDINPSPIVGLPPHSCGQTCSKPRATCPHPCPLECHAGPCPPCGLMGPSRSCFCGKHESSKRCSETDYSKGWNCGEVCGDMLPCGEHSCSRTCHQGLCGSCEVPVMATCYCGQTRKEISCERQDEIKDSFNYGQSRLEGENKTESERDTDDAWFEGSFSCANKCGRPYDCGHHHCEKECHPQEEAAAHCPSAPDVVLACPCGKTPLTDIMATPRQSCQDPIPRCEKICEKKLMSCRHRCQDTCHTGQCSPCTQTVDVPCRCGRTTTELVCSEGAKEPPLCERICRVQLNCGRHECKSVCCAGEKKALERLTAKRRNKTAAASQSTQSHSQLNEHVEPEHICLRVCGRGLKCGNHTCQQLCHKGPCAACPEAIFDDISCSCGRTVLVAPQPCGTRPPACRFDCTRLTACGHPPVQHHCHPDGVGCPKCPFLVEKACICGKQTLRNQPCWFEEVRCGLPCGRTLRCGAHKCGKPCHRPGRCEDADVPGPSSSRCGQPCGKRRRSCEHSCTEPCHAPAACREDMPCQSKTFVTCECQRRKQEARCLATTSNPRPAREAPALRCDDECLRLQRNRRLAEALRIDPDAHAHADGEHVPYSEGTIRMFREAVGWCQAQEREFRVFAANPSEKRLRFKPMQAQQRAFLHSLAEDYGLDSESQDPEPHRHVCVFKTPRFMSAPRRTLGQCVSMLKLAEAPPPPPSRSTGAATAAAIQPFNALLLSSPRFGLTIDEVDEALAADLATAGRGHLAFSTAFLPSTDEVLVRAHAPHLTAATVAAAAAAAPTTPVAVEAALMALRPALSRTVGRLGLAGGVALCHADGSDMVLRREGRDGSSSSGGGGGGEAGGWSAVVGRAAARRPAALPAPAEQKPASVFVALARKKPPPAASAALPAAGPVTGKAVGDPAAEPVDDDWEAAAERLEE